MKFRKRNQSSRLSLEGSRFRALDQARGRLALVAAILVIAYGIIGIRLVDLSVFQKSSQDALVKVVSEENIRNDFGAVNKVRQDIVDRNGVLLARSLKMTSLYADPVLVENVEHTAKKLSEIFPETVNERAVKERLSQAKRFVWIKRHLSPEEISAVLKMGEPGIGFKSEYRRVYPQGNLASHLVGYTDIDGGGLSGIEKGLDENLTVSDKAIAITLDIRVQHLLRHEIKRAVAKHSATAGAGIVMDMKTGEVLAAVSYPDFDPHRVRDARAHELFNRFSLGVYELGSTFKIFSTAAYLDLPGKTTEALFDVRSPIRKYSHVIRDYHGKKTILSLPEVFIYSSNIGAALMGEALGGEKTQKLFADLGLSEKLDITLPESGAPLLPSPWRNMNTLTASYGHGVAVSPLQFISAASTVLNNGELVTPVFVKDKNKQTSSNGLGYSVISSQTSQTMRKLMRLVVTHGTGNMADVKGYQVGGKTGTAEKSGIGGYDEQKLISSFLGMFPMSDPKYAVFIMIDEPKGTKDTYGYATGGWVAAPAVGNVIAGMGRILGVPKKAYADQGFIEDIEPIVRTNEEFENGVELMPKPELKNPPQPTPITQLYQESSLVSN